MRQQAGSNDLSEGDGNGVADQPADGLLADLFSRSSELVIRWEALEDRTFSKRNRPVLLRVAETTVAETKKLGCNRWGWIVPGHSPVNAWKALA